MTRIAQPRRDAQSSEWTVFADALQEANDPRGELIALNLAVASGMAPADRDAYVAKHTDALLGAAAAHAGAFRVVQWIGCIPDAVEMRVRPSDDVRTLFNAYMQSPLAAARSLSLIAEAQKDSPIDLAPVVAKLAASWPEELRSLELVDDRARQTRMLASRDFDPDQNLVTFGELERIWPRVESLVIESADLHQLDFGTIEAPALRRLAVRGLRYGSSYGDPPELAESLANAKWPELRDFELRLVEEYVANIIADDDAYVPKYAGHEDFEDRYDEAEVDGENIEGINWDQLAPLLNNLQQCPLERLALTSFDSADSLLETLAQTGLPKTLVELDLSDSTVRDASWFTQNAGMLRGLQRIVLERTPIDASDVKRLGTLGPQIVHSPGEGATYRYIVGSE